MNRNTQRKIHAVAGMMAFLLIFCFWTSTVISELFLSHASITMVKQNILYALPLLIVCIICCGVLGNKMAGKSQYAPIAAKRKRMPIIAVNGLFILLPSAFYLAFAAKNNHFDGLFYVVQTAELLAGATNLFLMSLSMRDGLSIRKPKIKQQ